MSGVDVLWSHPSVGSCLDVVLWLGIGDGSGVVLGVGVFNGVA